MKKLLLTSALGGFSETYRDPDGKVTGKPQGTPDDRYQLYGPGKRAMVTPPAGARRFRQLWPKGCTRSNFELQGRHVRNFCTRFLSGLQHPRQLLGDAHMNRRGRLLPLPAWPGGDLLLVLRGTALSILPSLAGTG